MSIEKQPPAPAANDEQSALATLKSLLLGPEQAELAQLRDEVKDPVVQSERVASSLPDSLDKAYQQDRQALTKSLQQPVSRCIEDSIQRNPSLFADILTPVMGPAIRGSISQAMKGLVQQINQTLEHSLTLKGLKWRIEAARSGVPFAEIVLRHTLQYRVEEAFLIQNRSGLLIQHVTEVQTRAHDADAVSAMLTAIRDFAQDTMEQDGEGTRLETVDLGEHTLWLVHGPRAYLAVAIRGVPPVTLRDELATLVTEIHRRHRALLTDFDGDPVDAEPVRPQLQASLQSEMAERGKRGLSWPLLLILLALLGGLAWWGYSQWQDARNADARYQAKLHALAELKGAPGVVVTEWQIEDDQLSVSGLHDPLTPAPAEVLQTTGLDSNDFSVAFRDYASTDRPAVIARIGRRLDPPDSVTLSLDDQRVLSAQGHAAATWIDRARLLALTIPGVDRFDDGALLDTDTYIKQRVIAALQPPDSVSLKVNDGVAVFTGVAPAAWLRQASGVTAVADDLKDVSLDRVSPSELGLLQELVDQIESEPIRFVSGIEPSARSRQRLAELGQLLSNAHTLAGEIGQRIRIELIGHTDGTGTPEQNFLVGSERADFVSDMLKQQQSVLPPFDIRVEVPPVGFGQPDAGLRRVELRVVDVDAVPQD